MCARQPYHLVPPSNSTVPLDILRTTRRLLWRQWMHTGPPYRTSPCIAPDALKDPPDGGAPYLSVGMPRYPVDQSLSQYCTNVKAFVRWATGRRLTNRLPKLSHITVSPPLNSGILGLRMGLYVPTPKFFYNLWGPREIDSSDS